MVRELWTIRMRQQRPAMFVQYIRKRSAAVCFLENKYCGGALIRHRVSLQRATSKGGIDQTLFLTLGKSRKE